MVFQGCLDGAVILHESSWMLCILLNWISSIRDDWSILIFFAVKDIGQIISPITRSTVISSTTSSWAASFTCFVVLELELVLLSWFDGVFPPGATRLLRVLSILFLNSLICVGFTALGCSAGWYLYWYYVESFKVLHLKTYMIACSSWTLHSPWPYAHVLLLHTV